MARSPTKRESFRGKLEKETLTSWTASLRPDSPPAAPAPSPAPPRRPRVPSHIVPRRSGVSPRVVSTPASKLFARVEDTPTPEARDTPRAAAPPPEPAPAALLDAVFGGDGDAPAAPPSSTWRELRTADGRSYFYEESTGEVRWEDPDAALRASGAWTEAKTSGGERYWYHTTTRESSWTDPTRTDKAWARSRTPEGYEFWYHTESGATSWAPP